MDNMRQINETMVKYVVDTTRQAVEFNQQVWANYVELTKTVMSKIPGLDALNKN